jgi:hypothetical protein
MIAPYQTKPSFTPRGASLSKLFFGVELEVEVGDDSYDRDEASEEVVNCLGNFIITKYDSTVPQGFEICSSPASLEYHNSAWNSFFDKTVKILKGFRSPNCGMHVHISRIPLSNLQIGKILVFIYNPDNYKFIRRIAERDSFYHNNFGEKRSFVDAKPEKLHNDRHTAVNLHNPNTIEIRLFKTNLKKNCFLKNIEFCHAIAKFTWPGQISLEKCKNWKHFVLFIKENKDIYPNLYNYLIQYKFLSTKRNPNDAVEETIIEKDINFNIKLKEKAKKVFKDDMMLKFEKLSSKVDDFYGSF